MYRTVARNCHWPGSAQRWSEWSCPGRGTLRKLRGFHLETVYERLKWWSCRYFIFLVTANLRICTLNWGKHTYKAKADQAPAHRACAPLFENVDSITCINFIVINMQCLQHVFHSLRALQKHRVYMWRASKQLYCAEPPPPRSEIPGSATVRLSCSILLRCSIAWFCFRHIV